MSSSNLLGLLSRAARLARQLVRATAGGPARGGRSGEHHAAVDLGGAARTAVDYDGPLPPLQYAPEPDEQADPGEVVWAWVPYEENDGRGKDRPVLVIARHRGGYLGLPLTSKDHDRDRADEARWGRHWIGVGSGAWDGAGRESEARLDRVLLIPQDAIRREGATLDKARYDAVAQALRALHA